MKNTMTSHKVYGVWEYERETRDLNEYSIKGWQLKKGGCFYSKFVRDENIRYIYQLDYAPKIEDREMYLSFFEEQGWEYINSTFNGWHYFRKKYYEGMPKEEMEIYSDQESLMEMQKRYGKLILFLDAVCAFEAVLCTGMTIKHEGDIALLLEMLFFYFGAIFFGLVYANIRRVQKNQKELMPIRYTMFGWGFMIFIFAFIIFNLFWV